MLCPNCNQKLTPPLSGRRLTCSFCGWVQSSAEQEGGSESEPLARKAEEIARDRQLDTEPVWRYVLIPIVGLAVLVLSFNLLVGAFHKDRPGQGNQSSPDPNQTPPVPAASSTPGVMAGPPQALATPTPMASSPPVASGNPVASSNPQVLASPQDGNPLSSAQPLPGSSSLGSALPTGLPSGSANTGTSEMTGESPGSQRSSIPVSALPTLVPPSNVLITPPPLPTPMLPSPRL